MFSNAVMRNLVWPGVALALLGISAVAIGGIYPGACRASRSTRARSTRNGRTSSTASTPRGTAFGLAGGQDRRRTPATNQPPPASLATDTAIVPNIRLLDPQLVSETYTQLQQVRGFYDFGEKLDIDRYSTAATNDQLRTTWSACGRSTTPS